MSDERKRYLGDGVYVDVDELGQLVLTTENGIEATNRIVLEPEVYNALVAYVAALTVGTKP
jgi:hypothetical protein